MAILEVQSLMKRFGAIEVLINRTATPKDSRANLILRAPIGQVFAELP